MAQIPVIFLAFANDHVDNASYLRNLPKELDGIRKALHDAQKAGLCEVIERANVTIEQLLDIFQSEEYRNRISIFHYGGHANGFQLLLEALDGSHASASSKGLIPFLGRQRGLKLVFLNGCSSQQQSLELVREGVPAVVGTSQSINDNIATGLAIRFYKAIGQGVELDRAWNEAIDSIKLEHDVSSSDGSNIRDLFWEGTEENTVIDRFPWDMHYREGSEIVKDWNLPDEVGNPLFNLPPIPASYSLPETPFLFFNRYDRKYAPVFFGRSYYIRDLFNKITNEQAPPVILLYGQSGVGKSSLLDAGILPRLETSHATRYIRRDDQIGLAAVLREALQWEQWEEELPDLNEAATSGNSKEEAVDPSLEARKHKLEKLITYLENQLVIASSVTKTSLKQAIKGLQQDLRSLSMGSAVSAHNILPEEKIQHLEGSLKDWRTIEARLGKPLLLIIDQVEELFTRPVEGEENELDNFVALLSEIFSNPSTAPKGKIILGYRKEYTPDIEEAFKKHQLPRNRVFLESMSKKDLIDVFKGLSETPALQERYNLHIENELPYIIADDLLEDRNSPVAPVLQILLTKLWQEATKQDLTKPHFTIEMYQRLKRDGILLDDFFHQQMEKMRLWAEEVELSGLALDILQFHTTKLGTAGSRSISSIRERYRHRNDIIDNVMNKFKELYLLNESGKGMTTLAHDTIAPLIQMEFRHSDRPGQRATRILENKATALERDEESTTLDFEDLELVEYGKAGMRFWVRKEQSLIDRSKARKEKYIRTQKNIKKLSIAAVVIIFVIAAFGTIQWQRSKILLHESAVNSLGYRAKSIIGNNPTLAYNMAQYIASFYEENKDNTVLSVVGLGGKKRDSQVNSNLRDILVKTAHTQKYDFAITDINPTCNIATSRNGMYMAAQDAKTNTIKLWSSQKGFLRDIDTPPSSAVMLRFTENNDLIAYYTDGINQQYTIEGEELDAEQDTPIDYSLDQGWENPTASRALLPISGQGNDYRFLSSYDGESKTVNIPAKVPTQNIHSVNKTGSMVLYYDTLSQSARSIYYTETNQVLPFLYYALEVRFSDSNDRHVGILTYDNKFILLNIKGDNELEVMTEVPIGPEEEYTDASNLALSPDEKYFLFYSSKTEEIVVWSIQSKTEVNRFSIDWGITGFTAGSQSIFALIDNNIYSWDVQGAEELVGKKPLKDGWVKKFSKPFSSTANFIQVGELPYAIGTQKNQEQTGDYLIILGVENDYNSGLLKPSYSNATNILYVEGYSAQLWSGQEGFHVYPLGLTGQAPTSPFSNYTPPNYDGVAWTSSASFENTEQKMVVMGNAGGNIVTWDLETDETNELEFTATENPNLPVSALHADMQNDNIVAAYYPNTDEASIQLHIWGPRGDRSLKIKNNEIKDAPLAVSMSPDTRFIALAFSSQLYIYNSRSGKLEEKGNIPMEGIYDITFTRNGKQLLLLNKRGIYSWNLLNYLLEDLPPFEANNPSLIAVVENELQKLEKEESYSINDPISQKKALVLFFMAIIAIIFIVHTVKHYNERLWLKLAIHVPSYSLLLFILLALVAAQDTPEYAQEGLDFMISLLFPIFLFLLYKEGKAARTQGKTNLLWTYLSFAIIGLIGVVLVAVTSGIEFMEMTDSNIAFSIFTIVALAWIQGSTYLWYKKKKVLFYILMILALLFIVMLFSLA